MRIVARLAKPMLVIGALSLLAANSFAETIMRPPGPLKWQEFLGINVQFHAYSPQVWQKQMTRLDQLGLNWIRWRLDWPDLEPEKGRYKLAELDATMAAADQRHYNMVAYLTGSADFGSSAPERASNSDLYPPEDFNVFADRMVGLVQRYPQVGYWQVWNEPNITWMPLTDSKAYYRLLMTTTKAIHAVASDKDVMPAGLGYYGQMLGSTGNMLHNMVDLGLAKEGFIAAYHPYSEYPEGDSVQDKDFLLRVKEMNADLRTGGIKTIWATEWGWSSYGGPLEVQHQAALQSQASYTLRRLALMSAMSFQRIFLFGLSDNNLPLPARDRNFGLLDLNGDPKPVYTALKNFLQITGPSLQPDSLPPMIAIPEDLYAVPWMRPDGTHVLMAWSASQAHLKIPGVKSAVLYEPTSSSHVNLADAMGIDVPLKPSLQILVWKP